MKQFLMGLIFLSGSLGYANELQISISPVEPTVINSDVTIGSGSGETTIFGPWILLNLNLRNMSSSDFLTISKVEFRGKIANSTNYTYNHTLDAFDLGGLLEIKPNGFIELVRTYLQELSESNQNLEMDVTVSGWIGTANNPQTRISKTLAFATR